MMRRTQLRPNFVEFIPERMDKGVLYISRRYNTASHLCCCGCGLEVVTPLNPAKWHLSEHPEGTVSLMPSVGNWSFPCKSHYFVMRNRIQWAGAMSLQQMAAVQARDQYDAELLAKSSRSRIAIFLDAVRSAWAELVETIKKWLRG
jgi:hypothetical protein